jgi:tRNA nucleotidyltransferase (CCA-adding enzyme)
MAAGVPEGPQVGETLRSLLERVLVDPALNTREELLQLVEGGS